MSAIGEMVRGRHPGQRISGDGVAVPVEQRLAQFAALVFGMRRLVHVDVGDRAEDRKSTRLNSSHTVSSYAVFCLKKKITSCAMTMMLSLHLDGKPRMTLTTVLHLSCALISGHLPLMLMELTKRRYAQVLLRFNIA